MFFQSRAATLAAIADLGARVCAYCVDPEKWPEGRCDCKYGAADFGRSPGEQTGCPELRSVHAIVIALSDDEWDHLIRRAGGTRTEWLFSTAVKPAHPDTEEEG